LVSGRYAAWQGSVAYLCQIILLTIKILHLHRYANKKLLHNRVYFTVPRFKLSQKFCTFCQTLFYHLTSPPPKTPEGLKAIKEKGNKFGEMVEEMHGGYSNKPIVAGNHFAVAMGMDVTMKGQGRMKMDEICVYEVKDGQIVKEQFFY